MTDVISRHERVINTILSGATPVLAFEVDVAQSAFQGLVKEQIGLGKALGEAMSQSSETWHDNAPADAVVHASSLVAVRAKRVGSLINNGVVIEYPALDEQIATLGTVVRYHFEGDDEIESILITGATRTLPDEIVESVGLAEGESLSAATVSSPLVASLLGKTAGETVSINPTGRRTLTYIIDEIIQFNPIDQSSAD